MNKSLYALCLMVLFGLLFTPSVAQSKYDLTTDTLSLSLYEDQRWEELYLLAKEAYDNDIDFYFLAVRGALASYHTGRYFEAENFFKRAGSYKRGNDYVREIHYLSALYAQLPIAVSEAYEALSAEAKKRYSSPEYKALLYLGVMSGYNYNQDQQQLQSADVLGYYGDRILFQNLEFFDVFAGHQFSPRWTINQTIEGLSIQKIQDAFTLNATSGNLDAHQQDILTQQWSYNLNVWFNVNDKVYLYPFFTYLNYQTNFLRIDYNADTYVYTPTNAALKGEQYLYGLGAKLRLAKMNLEASISRLQTEHADKYQSTVGLQFFPIPGKKHYVSTHWHSVNRFGSSEDSFSHLIFDFKLGLNIKKGWFDVSHSFGNHHFMADNYGATVYNTYETINSISSFNISYPVYQSLWLSVGYKYMNYSSDSFFSTVESGLYNETFFHNNHSISGGLVWYF